jgi:hypothetical protein
MNTQHGRRARAGRRARVAAGPARTGDLRRRGTAERCAGAGNLGWPARLRRVTVHYLLSSPKRPAPSWMRSHGKTRPMRGRPLPRGPADGASGAADGCGDDGGLHGPSTWPTPGGRRRRTWACRCPTTRRIPDLHRCLLATHRERHTNAKDLGGGTVTTGQIQSKQFRIEKLHPRAESKAYRARCSRR